LAAAAVFYATTPKPDPVVLSPDPAAEVVQAERVEAPEADESEGVEPVREVEADFSEREIVSEELPDATAEEEEVSLAPAVPSAKSPDPEQARDLERRAQQALSRISVKMYSTSWCPSCEQARAWFSANNIVVEEHDVERDESARRRMLRLNPKGSVPTIQVEERVHVGFGPQAIGQSIAQAVQQRMAATTAGPG
jgi:glutaredoxin